MDNKYWEEVLAAAVSDTYDAAQTSTYLGYSFANTIFHFLAKAMKKVDKKREETDNKILTT